jgi:serine/threonine protein kinase
MIEAGTTFPDDLRWRCVEDLVRVTAVLEQAGIVHGDLSPNNIVVDPDATADEPALYLVDFDAFVCPVAAPDQAVSIAAGGTYGTDGYCPPELAARAGEGDGTVAPCSDRYGRDMLMLELLFMDLGLSPDAAPVAWHGDALRRRYDAWRACCDAARWQALAHLDPAGVFSMPETERPASAELAARLGLRLPPKPTVRAAEPLVHGAREMPGSRAIAARAQRPAGRRLVVSPRKHARQPAATRVRSLGVWSVSARKAMRTRRWTRKPLPLPLPKSAPASVLAVIVIVAMLLFLPFLIGPLLSSCEANRPGDPLFRPTPERPSKLESPVGPTNPEPPMY